MKNVKNKAFLGSLLDPDSLANNLGVILSNDMACSILGPPKIPPNADDKVAPQTPHRTKKWNSSKFDKNIIVGFKKLTIYIIIDEYR